MAMTTTNNRMPANIMIPSRVQLNWTRLGHASEKAATPADRTLALRVGTGYVQRLVIGGREMKRIIMGSSLLAALTLSACSETNTPTQFRNVQVSFATQSAGSAPLAMTTATLDDTLTSGTDTLLIESAEIVLREIELKRIDVTNCDLEPGDDGCEEFETGPVLVSLPLSPGAEVEFDLDVPPGTYSEIEFDVHKVEDEPSDLIFLQAHPEFDKLSIRVTGTFNGSSFLFESDLGVEQELALVPALTVEEGSGSVNVTVFVDVDAWFRDPSGGLVDPDTGNKGGLNESLIKDNIKDSMEAFEDDDKDGRES